MAVNCLFLKWLLVFRLVTSFPQGFSLQELFPLLYFYNNLKKETPPQPTVPSQCQLNGLFLANCIFVTFGILCQWSVHPKRANNTRLGFLCVFLLSKLRLICPLFIFEGASLTCFHLCCLAFYACKLFDSFPKLASVVLSAKTKMNATCWVVCYGLLNYCLGVCRTFSLWFL